MNFEERTISSFATIRDDMDEFKQSMNDWIMFLDRELRDAKERVRGMQQRVEQLETERRLRF